MNPANQIEEPTSESLASRMVEPQRTVPTLAGLCVKVIARSETLTDQMKHMLKLGLPTTICDEVVKVKHDLSSYLKATPLNNDDFAMFADKSCAGMSRLDLRNCEIDDSMLNKLLSVHGKTLKYLDLSQQAKFSCEAIPESIDLRNLHTLVLGDQLGLFSGWRPRGNKSEGTDRLLTGSCPSLRILSLDISRWEEVFGANEETRDAASLFLKELLEPVRPNQLEVYKWNHAHGDQVWNSNLFEFLQSLSLPDSNQSALQSTLSAIGKFSNLRGLNMYQSIAHPVMMFRNPVSTLFILVKSLPHLESLDISNTNLTSQASRNDPLPLARYHVESSIPGLLGLHKSLKFLAVCWCPEINLHSEIPAAVVASFRNMADRLNALRHYQTRLRIFARLLSSCPPKASRELLEIICSRSVFESLVNLIGSRDDNDHFCVGNILSSWAGWYQRLPEAEKRQERYTGLLERIHQAALQFNEVLLNKRTDGWNYNGIFQLLRVSIDISSTFPDAVNNEIYTSQLLCTVEHILARGIPTLLRIPSSWEVLGIFTLLVDRIASGNEHVRRHLIKNPIQAKIWAFTSSGEGEVLVSGPNQVLDAIRRSKVESWQKIVQDVRADEAAWVVQLVMSNDWNGPIVETKEDLRSLLVILNDDKQTITARYYSSALLVHALLPEQSSSWPINLRNRIRDELWQFVVEFTNKGYRVVALLSFQQLVRFACVNEVKDEQVIASVERERTVQFWAFWSVGQVRLSEVQANKNEIPRLREAIDDLKKFNDAGFPVPDELLEMAKIALRNVGKVGEK